MAVADQLRKVFTFRNSPENPTTSLANPASWLTALFAPQSKSGANTSIENVISLPAVWRAITIVSESLASIPWQIIEERDGRVRVAKDHPNYNLLAREPSPLYTSFDFRRAMVTIALLKGNAYALIERDRRSQRPVKLRIFDNIYQEMHVIVTESGNLVYKHSSDLSKRYAYYDVIHIKGLSFDGVEGLNALSTHRENYGLGISARDFGNEFYRNGAFLSGYISVPQALSDEAYQRMKTSWNHTYSGPGNRGRTAILEQGGEFKSSMVKPEDAQMIHVQKFSIQDVARMFGVPSHLLNDLDRATFNNIEQLSLEFAKYTLRPWAERWEQECDRKLFPENEKAFFRTHLDLNAFLRGDTETQMERYRTMIQNGIMTINEVRAELQMNPVEGGDVNYIQLNMQSITSPIIQGELGAPNQNVSAGANTDGDNAEEGSAGNEENT